MRMYGFAWPERMKCEDLPEFGDPDNLCMDHNTTETKPSPPSRVRPQQSGAAAKYNPQASADGSRFKPVANGGDASSSSDNCQCKRCRAPWIEVAANATLSGLHGLQKVTSESSSSSSGTVCMLGCDSYPHFSSEQRAFTQYWIGIWSVLCCLSTISTVLTFLIDTSRFQYPERSIVYMCVCYVLVSIGYMLPLVIDRGSVACERVDAGAGAGEGLVQWVLRVQTRGPPACTISFLLVYYFGMAASLWWVILSLTWFFAAGLKWGHEAIARYAHYYHLVAWLLPCVASVVVIATSQVDGDPVAGICFVGGNNVTNLRGFIIAPLGSCLALGVVFLVAGFVSLFRIRKVIQQEGRVKTERFEKLMVRIGVFSLLYTLPAAALLACYLYEDRISDALRQPPAEPCICRGGGGGGGGQMMQQYAPTEHHQPEHAVFMLKYLMSLIVGVTSGIWIWTGKTVTTWRVFCVRLCSKDGAAHDYQHRHGDGSRRGPVGSRQGVKYAVPLPPLASPPSGLLQLLAPPQVPGGALHSTVPSVRSSMKFSQSHSNYNCSASMGPDSQSLLPSPLSHETKHLPVSQV